MSSQSSISLIFQYILKRIKFVKFNLLTLENLFQKNNYLMFNPFLVIQLFRIKKGRKLSKRKRKKPLKIKFKYQKMINHHKQI